MRIQTDDSQQMRGGDNGRPALERITLKGGRVGMPITGIKFQDGYPQEINQAFFYALHEAKHNDKNLVPGVLEHESDNEKDPNAVVVKIGVEDEAEVKIGFLPADVAEIWGRAIDEGASMDVTVWVQPDENHPFARVGVAPLNPRAEEAFFETKRMIGQHMQAKITSAPCPQHGTYMTNNQRSEELPDKWLVLMPAHLFCGEDGNLAPKSEVRELPVKLKDGEIRSRSVTRHTSPFVGKYGEMKDAVCVICRIADDSATSDQKAKSGSAQAES